jgi:APA family basic amino acid/polyamine antiporter
MMNENGSKKGAGFRRELSRFDAMMVVVGGIIGAGIFINPYIVAQRLETGPLVLAAWAAGGLIALAGAFTFAELGTLFPQAGGHYAYLRRAFHPLAGFLYGWGLLLMIEGGAIAAVGITFAEYFLRALGRSQTGATSIAVLGIAVVAFVNYLGVKPGSRVLNIFVLLKVAAIGVLIVAGFATPAASDATVLGVAAGAAAGGAAGAGTTGQVGSVASVGLVLAFGGALIPIMFSYGGWQNANYVAEEMRNPRRDLPGSLIAGTLIVVVVYGLINYVYLRTLGHAGLSSTLTPASDTARAVFGPIGDRLIAATIAVSTFGFLNLTMLAPTRVYFAMARDGVFMERVARLHPRFGTPSLAIGIQSVWAIALALTGTYAQLVDYVVFADWIFFGLAGLSLFVFRRRFPVSERPPGAFRTPGYPLIPGLFVLVALLIVVSVLRTNTVGSLIGIGLLLTGVPAFLFWRRSSREGGRE